MIKRFAIFILSIALLSSCGDSSDPSPDEQLFGKWAQEEIVTYTFQSDLTFEKINRNNPLDTAELVRTYGNFYSDKENRVISFTIQGFELDNGTIIDSSTVGPTWTYTIEEEDGQTVMNYQSNTSIGKLTRID